MRAAIICAPVWRSYLFANAVCIGVYYVLLSGGEPGWMSAALYVGVAAATVAAISVSRRRYRPGVRAGWWWLSIGQAFFVAAEAYSSWIEYFDGGFTEPSPADVLYIAAYPCLAVGLWMFIRSRTPGWNMASLLDAIIVAVGTGLLGWILLVEPLKNDSNSPLAAKVVVAAYPLMDLIILVLAMRLAFGALKRPPSLLMVIGAMALMLIADTADAAANLLGGDPFSNAPDIGWLSCYALLGAAALHPSMGQLDQRCPVAAPDGSIGRLLVLSSAIVAAPVVQLMLYLEGDDPHIVLTAVTCILMLILVMLRMAGLVAAHRESAFTDALTGVKNRRYLEQELAAESRRSSASGQATGLLIVDVDHFKRVNDTYGHLVGDEVLTEVARRLSDSTPQRGVVARYGGEEFAILLPSSDFALLSKLGDEIRETLSRTPFRLEAATLTVTASVGGAFFHKHTFSPETLLASADDALYRAKHAGRNRTVMHTQPTPRRSTPPTPDIIPILHSTTADIEQ